jgi:glycosyltransferase involved in cell wall biosynthesis
MSRLLIIASDHISAWIDKGEVITRYFNPGDTFDEIHILFTNDDNPSPGALKILCGRAHIFVHHHPQPPRFFSYTLGWNPRLIEGWVRKAVKRVADIRPDVIRCYGAQLNAYIASKANERLGVPYVISLHANPEANEPISELGYKDLFIRSAIKRLQRRSLPKAQLVMPVYQPIIPYLNDLGCDNVRVCYNMINAGHLIPKTNYQLEAPPRILSVGRQFAKKNPTHILTALSEIPEATLTLVGHGPYHQQLIDQTKNFNLEGRVNFVQAMNNDELCRSLHTYDFLCLHTDYFELSKVMLESFLVGLPVMLNYRPEPQVPELTPDICLRVQNSPAGYKEGLNLMLRDQGFRERLGRYGYERAQRAWAPEETEQEFSRIYRHFLTNEENSSYLRRAP